MSSTAATAGSSSSEQADGLLPAAVAMLPCNLLLLAAFFLARQKGLGLVSYPKAAALIVPAAQVAVAGLRVAAATQQFAAAAAAAAGSAQQSAARVMSAAQAAASIAACIRMAFLLSSIDVDTLKSTQHMTALLRSPSFGQLLLIKLAGQTHLLLQEHLSMPPDRSVDSSSSRSESQTTAAAADVQCHLQLWQDLQLPRTLLDQAAIALRKLELPARSEDATATHRFFLEAVTAATSFCTALAEAASPGGKPATSANVCVEQQQLRVVKIAMRVPLLLMDVAERAANRLSRSSDADRRRVMPDGQYGHVHDRMFVGKVLDVAVLARCWRLLDITSSNGAANSSDNTAGSHGAAATAAGAAAGGSSHSSLAAAAAAAAPHSVLDAHSKDCWKVLLQKLVRITHTMLLTPLQFPSAEPAAEASAAAVEVASNLPAYNAAFGSSSSSGAVIDMQECGGAAARALSAWVDRLHVVRSLVLVLNSAAEQQQQPQQQPREAVSRSAVEVMQLLQQHLRHVLLPLLLLPLPTSLSSC
jgi:hypothetical protein